VIVDVRSIRAAVRDIARDHPRRFQLCGQFSVRSRRGPEQRRSRHRLRKPPARSPRSSRSACGPAPEQFVEFPQSRERSVQDADFRAETNGHPRSVRATTPPPITTTRAGTDARYTAEQKASAACAPLQGVARRFDGKPSCHLAHRASRGSPPFASVTVSYAIAVQPEAIRPWPAQGPRQMQISEDNLALSQPGPFGSLGSLTFTIMSAVPKISAAVWR